MEYAEFIRATFELSNAVAARREALADHRATAATLTAAGQFREAESIYRDLLDENAADPVLWRELGLLYLADDRPVDGSAALLQSLSLEPGEVATHFGIGLAMRRAGAVTEVVVKYLGLLGLPPGREELMDTGAAELLTDAADGIRAMTERAIERAEAYELLGRLELARGRVSEAVDAYAAAHRLQPASVVAAEHLAAALRLKGEERRASLVAARAYYVVGRYDEAAGQFSKGLASQDVSLSDYVAMARALGADRRFEAVIAACQEGLRRFPDSASLFTEWVNALQNLNRTDEAVAVATAGTEQIRDDWALISRRELSLPVVYESVADIDHWRGRFARGLRQLSELLRPQDEAAAREALNAVDTHFYLPYQNRNDADLRAEYGRLVSRVLQQCRLPAYPATLAMPTLISGERIRVGYLSSSLMWNGVGELFLGWLTGRDMGLVETHVFDVGKTTDLVTRQFEMTADRYARLPRELDDVCARVRAARLHVLVFPEIGLDPFITQAASLRLAPVQCVAPGHPMTSGLPTIDYFLSSDFAEPDNAAEHYSERLIRLPDIAVCPRRPYPPEAGDVRATLGIASDDVVYFLPHWISKYLPQYDDLYPAIAAQVPRARFVFVKRGPEAAVNVLWSRLAAAFARHDLDIDDYVLFVPQVEYDEYLRLNVMADAFLDTPGWSGGFSSLDALGCGLPLVTLPGALMRGRQSYGYLRLLGVTETVAADESEYVAIAARLGNDADWREELRDMIRHRLPRLYDCRERVRGLHDFYHSAVAERTEAVV